VRVYGSYLIICTENNNLVANVSPLINDSGNRFHRQADIFVKVCWRQRLMKD